MASSGSVEHVGLDELVEEVASLLREEVAAARSDPMRADTLYTTCRELAEGTRFSSSQFGRAIPHIRDEGRDDLEVEVWTQNGGTRRWRIAVPGGGEDGV